MAASRRRNAPAQSKAADLAAVRHSLRTRSALVIGRLRHDPLSITDHEASRSQFAKAKALVRRDFAGAMAPGSRPDWLVGARAMRGHSPQPLTAGCEKPA